MFDTGVGDSRSKPIGKSNHFHVNVSMDKTNQNKIERISGLWTASSRANLNTSAKTLVGIYYKVMIWFYAIIWAHMVRI